MGKYKNQFLGTIGDLGAFSFHETKNIIGGQGWAISINNKSFIKKMINELKKNNIRISLFVEPKISDILLSKKLVNAKKDKKIMIKYIINIIAGCRI